MMESDVRWEQRFNNFLRAVGKLESVVLHKSLEQLSELEREGLIQRFRYTFELAWKTLQDFLKYKGYLDIVGPNPTLEQAFQDGYLENGPQWKLMKKSRDLSFHTYNEETAEDIAQDIFEFYYSLFKSLATRLEQERNGRQFNLFD